MISLQKEQNLYPFHIRHLPSRLSCQALALPWSHPRRITLMLLDCLGLLRVIHSWGHTELAQHRIALPLYVSSGLPRLLVLRQPCQALFFSMPRQAFISGAQWQGQTNVYSCLQWHRTWLDPCLFQMRA